MNKVVVLIPHYNNPEGLKKSVGSISPDEEVDILVVDDGSKKRLNDFEITAAFKAKGSVNFLFLKENAGIENALNTGLSNIKSNNYLYIARLDCDDICSAGRFKKQETFLDNNPDIFLLGTFAEAISPEGEFLYNIKMPTEHRKINNKMYYNSMFIHPTVMFRTTAIHTVGLYPTNYPAAEDYAYFFKFVKNFKTAILPESLVKIQIDDTGISAQKRKAQVRSRLKLIKENFYIGYFPIVGLLRNYIILFIPRTSLKKLKVLLFQK